MPSSTFFQQLSWLLMFAFFDWYATSPGLLNARTGSCSFNSFLFIMRAWGFAKFRCLSVLDNKGACIPCNSLHVVKLSHIFVPENIDISRLAKILPKKCIKIFSKYRVFGNEKTKNVVSYIHTILHHWNIKEACCIELSTELNGVWCLYKF